MIENRIIPVSDKKIIRIITTLENYVQNKRNSIILTLITFFSGGHLLIEDLPGVGKTTLAIAISKALGMSFGRIQCTPDLLPSDITGITIYNKEKNEFVFNRGPVFNNMVLIDEINRTTQKTQSALLEAMEEEQVTIDGKSYPLPKPFFVMATQNPSEHYGTFPLPDSQMDRFMLNISMGYPIKDEEIKILKKGSVRKKLDKIVPLISKEEIFKIKEKIDSVYTSEKVLSYIVDIVNATRKNKFLITGVSPRCSLAIMQCCKALAYFNSRDYISPEDVKVLAPFVVSHRIIFRDEYSSIEKKELVCEIVENVSVPV